MSEFTNESVAQIEATLSAVDHALERLRLGTYRTCEACGSPLNDDELVTNPLRTFCDAHLEFP